MTPYHRMEDWYRTHPAPRPFAQYVEMHLQAGVVVANDDFFLLARAVNSHTNPWRIVESMQTFPRSEQDCWYVFAFCGDLRRVWDFVPYPLPLVAFNRHNQKALRFTRLSRLRFLCNGKLMA